MVRAAPTTILNSSAAAGASFESRASLSTEAWTTDGCSEQGVPSRSPSSRHMGAGTGSVLNRNSLWRLIKALVKRTDLGKKVTPHTFRHSMCTVAIQNGAPVALVSKTLGHSTVAVTSRYINMNENLSVGSFLTKNGGGGAAEK